MIPSPITLLLLFACIFTPGEHEFYVSVIEVKHSAQTQSVNCRIRVFSDDLQVGLQSEYDLAATPPLPGLCTDHNAHINGFLSNHVSLSINDIPRKVSSIRCITEGDIHSLEWQVDSISSIQTLYLRADYLMDIFPTQTQMIHFSSGEEKRTLRLTKDSPAALIHLRS